MSDQDTPATDQTESASQPTRVRQFLAFFKNYMSLSTLVVAALPVPMTMLGYIPTYAAQSRLLSLYTSLFCFLLLGYVFYSRHSLARRFFPGVVPGKTRHGLKWMPLALIVLSALLLLTYQQLLIVSATLHGRENMVTRANVFAQEYDREMAARGPNVPLDEKLEIIKRVAEKVGLPGNELSMEWELKHQSLEGIPFGLPLIALYLAFFVTTEAAFALMALREYLQDVLQLSDAELIRGTG